MRTDHRIQGYTLIEVLVAMMILAMSLTVLFRIFSGGLRNVDVSADYARAVIIAEARLAEAGMTTKLEAGEYYGVVQDRFQWTQNVEAYLPFANTDSDALPIAAYQVTVAVAWEHRGRIREISLSTIKLDREGAT